MQLKCVIMWLNCCRYEIFRSSPANWHHGISRIYLLAVLLATYVGITTTLLNGPQDLDSFRDNSSVIVEGSVIQLFCSASGQFTAPIIQWTWNNVTIPETSKLPHLMVKSWTQNNTITSSVLTIYGFSTRDNGSYQCNASDNGSYVSQPLLLTAINSSNVLTLIRELNNNIGPDRTSVPLGSSNISSSGSFLRCSAQQPPSSSLTAPSMIWLKDGTQLSGDGVRVVITTTNSTVGISNRTTSFVRIFNFSQSDAGVYQCVFYDSPSQGGEVITTRPYKVDTGVIGLSAISSPITVLPTLELVALEVEAVGEYDSIQWLTPTNVSGLAVDFDQTYILNSQLECGAYCYEVALIMNNSLKLSVNFTVILCSMSQPSITLPITVLSASNYPSTISASHASFNLPSLSTFTYISSTTSSLISVEPSPKMPHQLYTTSLLLGTVNTTPTCCITLPSGDKTGHIYALVALILAILALFCSATTVVLLIRSYRCREKYNTIDQTRIFLNHHMLLNEEQCARQSNSSSNTTPPVNRFHIVEYASFHPDRISSTNLNLLSSAQQNTPLMPQCHTPTSAIPPCYSVVQPKTKQTNQPENPQNSNTAQSGNLQGTLLNLDTAQLDNPLGNGHNSERAQTDSPLGTQYNMDTAETTEDVDCIATKTTLIGTETTSFSSKVPSVSVSSEPDQAQKQIKTETSTLHTARNTSLRCSQSFCFKDSAKQGAVKNEPMVRTNSNNTDIHKQMRSTQPPLPSRCIDVHKSSNSPTLLLHPIRVGSYTGPNSDSIQSCSPVPQSIYGGSDNSVASAYEIPMTRLIPLNTSSKCLENEPLGTRSKSFSVNHSSPVMQPLSPLFSTNVTSIERLMTAKNESGLVQCPALRTQFSISAESLPRAELPRRTMV